MTSVAAAFALAALQTVANPVGTTVCGVLANPSAFDGKVVRFRAGVRTDWTHGMYLIDRGCKGAIQLVSIEAVEPNTEKAFDEAVGTELNGGFKRTAVATFTGLISWKPEAPVGELRYNPIKFVAHVIQEVEVSRKWNR